MAYYDDNLSGDHLRRCYEVATPRVRRYLQAEIDHLRSRLRAGDEVLELGCGYGRVAFALAPPAGQVVGVDTAAGSIALARDLAGPGSPCGFLEMDASALTFPHRLEWFELQASGGMMGAIDHEATGDGVIVCEDGFRTGFMRADDFRELWCRLGLDPVISTVDDSVTFCESKVSESKVG